MQKTQVSPDKLKVETTDDHIQISVRIGNTQTWNFQTYDHETAKRIMDEIRKWLIETGYI